MSEEEKYISAREFLDFAGAYDPKLRAYKVAVATAFLVPESELIDGSMTRDRLETMFNECRQSVLQSFANIKKQLDLVCDDIECGLIQPKDLIATWKHGHKSNR